MSNPTLLSHAWAATSCLLLAAALASRDAAANDAPPRLAKVARKMQQFVAAGEVSGVVTMVVSPERTLHLDAVGLADVAARRPVRADSIFWIASMTKPVTASAVMMLQDDGKLSVDDPVAKHLPEFASLKTKEGQPANLTIRHLLTHTSGMAEISNDEARRVETLSGLVPLYVSRPVLFEPGSKWVYCQSSINTAARIVEVASGKSFTDFLSERLFGPLGMNDTTFYLNEAQAARLAKSYRRGSSGLLEETENFILLGKSPLSRQRFPAANGGLFSTAPDYARFCQMILGRGSLGGRQYLKPESVALMTSVQTGDLTTGFTAGNGWGLGWCVVREPQGASAALSAGTFGHGGAYGTQAWLDPVKRRAYLLMIQRADYPNADNSSVRRSFQDIAAAELGP